MDQATQLYIKELCAIGDPTQGAIKISPIGMVSGIDGRVFEINGAKLLQDLQSNGLKLALNVEHGENDKYGGEAAGWFDQFELKGDGIYAHLALNKSGKELLDNQSYKYLSPEYLSPKAWGKEVRQVQQLVGIGLVNQPNLLNQALNKINPQTTGEKTMDAQKHTDALKQLKDDNKILREKLDAQDKELREQKVNNAISAGKLIPAKKDFALALDANALESFLTMESENTTLQKDDNALNPDTNGDHDAGNDIFNQLGI